MQNVKNKLKTLFFVIVSFFLNQQVSSEYIYQNILSNLNPISILFRSEVTAILKKGPIFADFNFSADVSMTIMIIYSFYVWFSIVLVAYWVVPVYQFSCL